jgi:hypothetical protein
LYFRTISFYPQQYPLGGESYDGVTLSEQVQKQLGQTERVVITKRVDDVVVLLGHMRVLDRPKRTYAVEHAPGEAIDPSRLRRL